MGIWSNISKILVISSLMFVSSFSFASNDPLAPENWGNFCPADFTKTAPKDFHTNLPLQFAPQKQEELHRLVCEKFDAKTMQLKAKWNLYYCEDLNLNNYTDKEFYVSVNPWFMFHPNYKKAEFMLFPKYTKWIRQKIKYQGEYTEIMTLHFMRNHQSEMQIVFENSPKADGAKIKAGAKSVMAQIFRNVDMKVDEDPIICTIN